MWKCIVATLKWLCEQLGWRREKRWDNFVEKVKEVETKAEEKKDFDPVEVAEKIEVTNVVHVPAPTPEPEPVSIPAPAAPIAVPEQIEVRDTVKPPSKPPEKPKKRQPRKRVVKKKIVKEKTLKLSKWVEDYSWEGTQKAIKDGYILSPVPEGWVKVRDIAEEVGGKRAVPWLLGSSDVSAHHVREAGVFDRCRMDDTFELICTQKDGEILRKYASANWRK